MPVRPAFEWEQTHEDVFLHITIKGFKRDAVDVFVSSVFAKVNAPPTYLLVLDLLHPVDPEASTHYFDGGDSTLLHVKLRKAEPGVTWDALCVGTGGPAKDKKALLERRAESMRRAEESYNKKLEARGAQREAERRRMTEEQWEVEKRQRRVIEQRFEAEKAAAEQELYTWEEENQKTGGADSSVGEKAQAAPQSPADILAHVAAPSPNASHQQAEKTTGSADNNSVAPVRGAGADTINVAIDFTPKLFAMPTRSRGDEEHYRQSRYKPVSVEDSPMFWKERADGLYRSRDWRGSANAYSESIKRDGVFLTCVMNRAACYLHLGEFKKAVEDCTLSLTMLANTPASEITQERYRGLMTKLHARRGAAYCWSGELAKGLADLKMAAAYRDPTCDEDVLMDVAAVEQAMAARGMGAREEGEEEHNSVPVQMQEASALYYKNDYGAAETCYRKILEANPYHVHARSNLVAALLQQGQFKEALKECEGVIGFCSEVAEALNQPGALSTNEADSDDEDDVELAGDEAKPPSQAGSASLESGEEGKDPAAGQENRDEMARKRRAAARKISESSGHVYLLLKAYVRAAAALSGLKDYRSAHTLLERALRITPYDNTLLDDCNRLAEKIRLDTLVAASTGTAK